MRNYKWLAAVLACALLCGCGRAGESSDISSQPQTEASIPVLEITTAATTEAAAETTTEASHTESKSDEPEIIGNTITLLGTNAVYTGESYRFKYKTDGEADIKWLCEGNAGEISDDGTFTAKMAGTAVVSVRDSVSGSADYLTVNVVDSPADIDFLVEVYGIPIANKSYPAPKDYAPSLTDETYDAFLRLKQAAAEEGLAINFMSGYRSYAEQKTVYERWVETYPLGGADRISARPGHSEHQLGLAIDVNSVEFSFADTPEGIWLAENCHKFGFIIRYPRDTEQITGYMFEPWHIRYVGESTASEVYMSGLTLEEYLGIDSYYRIEKYASE